MPASPWWKYGVLLFLPSLVLAGSFKHVNHKHWSDNYDRFFKKYSKHYFGVGFDWRWFKAQGIAESGLQPDAISSSGARGIMQIVPTTFAEIQASNPGYLDIDDPQWNIAAAIYYDRRLYRRWNKQLPGDQLLDFTFASYNAGFSRIQRARKKAGGEAAARAWKRVAPFSPPETRNYVQRIRGLMQRDARSG
jgi:membrane-bound lytic murein transglycosylase F